MPPSSNWLALKKKFQSPTKQEHHRPTKRRKVETSSEGTQDGSVVAVAPRIDTTLPKQHASSVKQDSVDFLRKMVLGQVEYSPAHQLTGKYLAIDCEMVGIAGGPKDPSLPGKRHQGDESSLARVSVVNYHGAVQLDVFVKQRERVTDWRTEFSGVRESDMVNAKPFLEVQKLVSDLLKDRILVGHAVHNDLKVLLLSHPHNMMRDTQTLAGLHGTLTSSKVRIMMSPSGTVTSRVGGSRKPALRKLVGQELGIEIQTGEHSSVIDARATMAIYRLHRKTWDRGFNAAASAREWERSQLKSDVVGDGFTSLDSDTQKKPMDRKRPRDDLAAGSPDGIAESPVGAHKQRPRKKPLPGDRKGHSSGLSVVVKRRQGGTETKHTVTGVRGGGATERTTNWWGTLGRNS